MVITRRYRDSDAPVIAALTLAAIRQTALKAYSPEQVSAWSARYSVERLIQGATKGDWIRVAVDADDAPVAYAVMETDGHVDMLYCHPNHTSTGLARHLLAEAEMAARALGVAQIFTEASELAKPVFERAGYSLLHRRDFTIPFEGREVAIHNYAMEKRLA
ncbi:MAG: GNAT family N-acetyltransferase [Erythrobacter sp.]|nr:GNAT family N-acetyltransferase [Erythrobacter sp.]